MDTFTGDRNFDYYIMNSQAAKEEIIKIVRGQPYKSGQPYKNMERDLNNLSALLNDVDANDLIAFLAQWDRARAF